MLISKKPIETVVFIFNAVILCFCCNSFLLMRAFPRVILPIVLLFIVANLLTLFSPANFPNFRTNVCNHGVKLLVIFIISIIPSAVYHIFLPLFLSYETRWALFFYSLLTAVLAHAIFFWNAICIPVSLIQCLMTMSPVWESFKKVNFPVKPSIEKKSSLP